MATIDEATQNFINNLHEKTGKPLHEWVEMVKAAGHSKHKEIIAFLKAEKGLTHGYANLIALHTTDPSRGAGSVDDQVGAIFSGAKAAFRPVYDAVESALKGFGDDIEFGPKKGYVSVRRKKQFVTIEPKSARVDVCINLGDAPETGRLEKVPNPGMMPSHRVQVTAASEVDGEFIGWLKTAYDRS